MATATKSRSNRSRTPAKPKATTPETEAQQPETEAPKSDVKLVSFNADSLPQTGTVQFRQGGDYKPFIRALSAFAKGTPAMGNVKALIHLGWVKPGGVNSASKSTAFTLAEGAELSDECFTVGEPAAQQIVANLQALAEAGAPVEALNGLWAAYVGVE